jgi:hypothetical protein
MSERSLIGALGMGRQGSKDNVASAFTYMPATNISLNIQQNTQTLPAEIGGSYFLRGSYKGSASGSGDISAVVRPNSFGQLLMALSGVDTVTPVAGQSGAYQHVFTPFAPGSGTDLPWYTLQKDVSRLWTEQYLNAKLASLRLDIPKNGIATCQATWFATTPSMKSTIGGQTFDSTPQFQASVGSVTFTPEGNGSNISANSTKFERISITNTNNLSQDEFSVGSFYADDVTLLQRTLEVSLDIIVRDSALYEAVYANGNAVPTSWDPTVYRGTLTVTLNGTANVPTTTQPYQMILAFPGLDFLMMPTNLAGADLVRATLSTQVTLGTSGSDTYQYTLINGVASY